MNTRMNRPLATTFGGLLLTLFASVAAADDTEIFFNSANGGGNANIMFIFDTSGSMNDVVTTQRPYDSTRTYAANTCAGNFIASNVYYGSGSTVPACGSTQSIPMANFKCLDAAAALAAGPGTTSAGYYSGSNLIQWGQYTVTTGKGKSKVTTTTKEWQGKLGLTGGSDVECKNDASVAGNGIVGGSPSGNTYPSKNANATSTAGIWDLSANNWWAVSGNAGGAYVIYSANYLNYYYDSTQSSTNTKVAVLQQAAASILSSVSNVNVGLMRYDANGAGGMVLNPIAPIATNGPLILANVNADAPSGTTPISESLYEAYLYYSGGGVQFGNTSFGSLCSNWVVSGTGLKTCSSFTTPKQPSVASSRNPATATGANYNSPANSSCQKNFVVFLTDGLPNSDSKANSLITKLPNFAKTAGSCYASSSAMYTALGTTQPSGTDGTGLCSAAMASYMFKNDMRPDVNAVQNVTTYMIGFGNDFATSSGAPTASFDYLQDVAAKGGGKAFTATSLSDLTSAFNEILASVVKTNTLFSAPAVAVNAFNRTQTLNDLYVSVFSPKTSYHWPGNMKRYQVVNGAVVDVNGAAAVDPSTGFFKTTAQSFWSATPDGSDVTLGGAASNIPQPTVRNVYTYIGTNPTGTKIPLSGNATTAFNTSNALLTPTLLNVGGTGDPSLTDLINWARGQDVNDDNSNGNITEAREAMGDPIHTAPSVVIYGKNADGSYNTVAYVPTNDGYLHAVNANTGVELWSYIPQEMLLHLKDLFNDDGSSTKHYGIDGPISVLQYDINGDGTIDPTAGDRVILYFGTGRNTDTADYYAVDVTDPNNPALLWVIDGNTLTGLGQAWSQPVITRVNISGATQNSQKVALIMGGGYDPTEDGFAYQAVTSPEAGSHLYMVDALKGTLLWSAGSTGAVGSPYNFVNARLDHAIPSNVAVLDLNGDGYADRLYVGDVAGQLWRFDITNGNDANHLVTGGVIASLGARDVVGNPAAQNRRFYSTPDVSLQIKPGVSPFVNVALGSGYRGHPLDKTVQDRFYDVRDTIAPFTPMLQSDFDARALIRDASVGALTSLYDITLQVQPVMPVGSIGWQLDLNRYGGWVGEKSLSPSTTLDGSVIFTTYTPTTTVPVDPCAGVGAGTNRVYVVDVFDGSPTADRNKDGTVTIADRAQDLAQGGIAPQASVLFLPPGSGGTGGSSGSGGGAGGGGAGGGSQVTVLIGAEVLNFTFGQRVKTYWRETGAN